MPYSWIATPDRLPATPARLDLWPHRSLPPAGFAGFIGVTALLIAVPLVPLLGTWALWGLLPFLVAAIWGLWWALRRSYRDGALVEVLTLEPDRIALVRHDARRAPRAWEANPYWVSVHLHPKGGPVPNYLTLKGAGREVELGAFLGADERLTLRDDLLAALAVARR